MQSHFGETFARVLLLILIAYGVVTLLGSFSLWLFDGPWPH